MPGIKGMTAAKPRSNAQRRKIWQSMRIMRRFTIPDLCRTAGTRRSNTRKFLLRLVVHGYAAPFGTFTGGRAGEYQSWRIVKDTGPDYPLRCEICGRALCEPCEKENSNE